MTAGMTRKSIHHKPDIWKRGIADPTVGREPSDSAGERESVLPFVSVIIPMRNEINHIDNCLQSIRSSTYAQDRLEVLVVDGESEDGSDERVRELAREHSRIRLLKNPDRIVPTALNRGLEAARGEVVIRMDAHAEYPQDYISLCVQSLQESGADNVGGVWEIVPSGANPVARAIAAAQSHRFGVGNAYYRTGTDLPRWVDTVPFGCYRREVFHRIGGFDPTLVRNQDDEFNARLIRQGGKILLDPRIRCRYYARGTLAKAARMFYQYGYYKPEAARRVGAVMTLRQLVPPAFVAGVTSTVLLAPLWKPAAFVLLMVSLLYLALAGVSALTISRREGWAAGLLTIPVFAVMHFSYGLGFLKGILDFLILRRRPDQDAPLTR